MSHHFEVRVYYEDTDMGGIVYHANFLKFIERARSDWVRGLGIDQNEMRAAGTVFVVRHLAADYLRPARFDDLLTVTTEPAGASGARFVLRQQVRRGEDLLFSAEVTLVAVGPDGRPARMPADIRRAFG
jgi:acyl-CoA thioester hydrolase